MAKYSIEDTTLTNISNAIRGKDGTTAAIPVTSMADRISALPEGGGATSILVKAANDRCVQCYDMATHKFIDVTTTGVIINISDCMAIQNKVSLLTAPFVYALTDENGSYSDEASLKLMAVVTYSTKDSLSLVDTTLGMSSSTGNLNVAVSLGNFAALFITAEPD